MMNEGANRRFVRVSRIFLTAVESFTESGEIDSQLIGRTLNVSEGGVLLEMKRPVPLLSTLTLSFAFGEDIIKTSGRVTRLSVNDRSMVETGIEFTDISDESRQIIRNNATPEINS